MFIPSHHPSVQELWTLICSFCRFEESVCYPGKIRLIFAFNMQLWLLMRHFLQVDSTIVTGVWGWWDVRRISNSSLLPASLMKVKCALIPQEVFLFTWNPPRWWAPIPSKTLWTRFSNTLRIWGWRPMMAWLFRTHQTLLERTITWETRQTWPTWKRRMKNTQERKKQ